MSDLYPEFSNQKTELTQVWPGIPFRVLSWPVPYMKGYSQVETMHLKDGKVLFFNSNGLRLFVTGRYSDLLPQASVLAGFSALPPPAIPQYLSYENAGTEYITLSWSEGTRPIFYNIRAGDDNKPEKFLYRDGVITHFVILKNPCLTEIEKFFFQVKANDDAYAESAWSEQI